MLSSTGVMSHKMREQQAELYCFLESKNIQIWIELGFFAFLDRVFPIYLV